MTKLNIACIFLASGLSRRFGANKLLADFQGEPLAQRVINSHPSELFVQNIIVTRYPEIALMSAMRGFTICENISKSNDISHTINLGLNALQHHTDGCMFTVCDLPFFTTESCEKLVFAFRQNPYNIISASCDGVSKNPCIFPKGFYPQLKALSGNHGGKHVIEHNLHALINVELPANELKDIDTKADLINVIP